MVASLSGDQLDCPLGITVDQQQSALTTHRHPFSDHHKINGTTGFLYYLQLLSGPDKVHFPTYFVPYLPHSCILTDCATMLPEIDSLLLLVSVSYDSCKPLLDYVPMGQPSLSQKLLGLFNHAARLARRPSLKLFQRSPWRVSPATLSIIPLVRSGARTFFTFL